LCIDVRISVSSEILVNYTTGKIEGVMHSRAQWVQMAGLRDVSTAGAVEDKT